jgi:hypothetical protein
VIRVTAVDLDTGEEAVQYVEPGNYAVVSVEPCYVDSVQNYRSGTSVVTIKGRKPELMGFHEAERTVQS